MTPGATLSCPKCNLSLDPASAASSAEVECAACRSGLTVRLYPAFTHPPEAVSTATGEHAIDGEAACFFHPEKRASISCERCGRFLCALCDVPFGGRHLCPLCLDATKVPELINRRVVWGHVAALIGLLPMLVLTICFPLWFLCFVTGPTAIILAIWKWNAPGSLVHGQRRGLALAGILGGLLQVGGIVGLIWLFIWAIRHNA